MIKCSLSGLITSCKNEAYKYYAIKYGDNIYPRLQENPRL